MSPEDGFLLEVLSHPDDPAPRLVYADWLEEQGDERAAAIRLGCEVLAAPAGSDERRLLREGFRLKLPAFCRDLPEVEGLVLTWSGLVAVFRYRLAEAIAWCAGRPLPLRSAALDPGPSSSPVTGWGERTQRVCLKRTKELARLGRSPGHLADDLAGGKLLVFEPGLAAAEREVRRGPADYLDRNNCPPWDCWLAYGKEADPAFPYLWVGGYVLAWVPPHLVADVNRAMARHPTNAIRWAADFDRYLIRHLRDAGLIT